MLIAVAEQTDINFVVWWVFILLLVFASIGAFTTFQIMRVAFTKPKPPEEPRPDWPEGRVCLLLRIPNLGTPATGGKMGSPKMGGKMRVEFKITGENGRVWHVSERVEGYTEKPFMRLYTQSLEGDAEGSAINLTPNTPSEA